MNPVKQGFAILFFGGALVFVLLAYGKTSSDQKKLDDIAQAAGFADDGEMKAAKEKGFVQPLGYREFVKKEADIHKLESEKRVAAAAKAKAEADADKQIREVRFQQGAAYAIALKKGMKNPDSFKLESARRTGDGVFCFEYRAANSFNAIIPGQALVGAGKAATSDQPGFVALWNKFCTKASEDFDTIVYAMKNGYF